MIVTIPACAEHMGVMEMTIEIDDVCPVCGGPRGKPKKGLSFDGSRRLVVDIWSNPCGHVDFYSNVREEYLESINKNEPAPESGETE